jgi:hypothetical protein
MYKIILLSLLLYLCASVPTFAVANPLQTQDLTASQYHAALTTFDGTFGSRWYPATSAARDNFTDSSVSQLIFDKDGSGTFVLVTDPIHHIEVYVNFQWRLDGNSLTVSVPSAATGDQAMPVKSGAYTIGVQRVVKGLPALDSTPEMASSFYLLIFDKPPVASSNDEYYKRWLRPIELKESKE